MSILTLLMAMAVWGIVHSFLASHLAKDLFPMKSGGMNLYRLAYNVFAVVSFLPVLYLMGTLPNQPLYKITGMWSYLMMGGQLLAALFLVVVLLQTDTLSFMGLRQLFEKEKTGTLVTSGFYRYMRHPLYTFGLLFIWLTPAVTLNSLTVFVGATIYILIGAYFEERKLLRDFGEAYAEYKRKTPMLIPGLMFGKD